MKKIVCLAFVLITSIGSFAQEKTIQRAEFEQNKALKPKIKAAKIN
jgi:hypothetical protein